MPKPKKSVSSKHDLVELIERTLHRLQQFAQWFDWHDHFQREVERNGPLKQKFEKASEQGLNKGITSYLVKNAAAPASLSDDAISIESLVKQWKSHASSIEGVLRGIQRLAVTCGEFSLSTTGSLRAAFEDLAKDLDWHAGWLADGQKQFKRASSVRKLRDANYRLDLIVTYSEVSSGRARYDLISELVEVGYSVSGDRDSLSPNQLKMRVRRFRARNPKLHKLAASQVSALIKIRAAHDVGEFPSLVRQFVFSGSNTKPSK